MARRRRHGDLSLSTVRNLSGDIETFGRFAAVVELDEARAADPAFLHGLGGFEAVQPAGAPSPRDSADGEALAFSSFDDALDGGAVAEGLTVLGPLG